MCKESTVFNKYKRLKNMINKKKEKKEIKQIQITDIFNEKVILFQCSNKASFTMVKIR